MELGLKTLYAVPPFQTLAKVLRKPTTGSRVTKPSVRPWYMSKRLAQTTAVLM